MRRARAAVMPADGEFFVAEMAHDLDLVLRHGAERIVDVVQAPVLGAGAVAVAAQIRRYHVVARGEPIGHFVPRHVGERIAVQQQERRPAAAVTEMNARATGVEIGDLKVFEHARLPQLRAGS